MTGSVERFGGSQPNRFGSLAQVGIVYFICKSIDMESHQIFKARRLARYCAKQLLLIVLEWHSAACFEMCVAFVDLAMSVEIM